MLACVCSMSTLKQNWMQKSSDLVQGVCVYHQSKSIIESVDKQTKPSKIHTQTIYTLTKDKVKVFTLSCKIKLFEKRKSPVFLISLFGNWRKVNAIV